MNQGNVIPLGCITRLDLPAERVLEQAKGKVDRLVIMGWKPDGELYFSSSIADGGEVLWLMEKCKQALMDVEVDG